MKNSLNKFRKIALLFVMVCCVLNAGHAQTLSTDFDVDVVLPTIGGSFAIEACGASSTLSMVIKNNSGDTKTIQNNTLQVNLPIGVYYQDGLSYSVNGGTSLSTNISKLGTDNRSFTVKLDDNFTLLNRENITISFNIRSLCDVATNQITYAEFFYHLENLSFKTENKASSVLSVFKSNLQIISPLDNSSEDIVPQGENTRSITLANPVLNTHVTKIKVEVTYNPTEIEYKELKVNHRAGGSTVLTASVNTPSGSKIYYIDAPVLGLATGTDLLTSLGSRIDITMVEKVRLLTCSGSPTIQYNVTSEGIDGTYFSSISGDNIKTYMITPKGVKKPRVFAQKNSAKCILATDCNRIGKIRYTIKNDDTSSVSAYDFASYYYENYGHLTTNGGIYYIYKDAQNQEQKIVLTHKNISAHNINYWYGLEYLNDVDGPNVGLDIENGRTKLLPGKEFEIEYWYELSDFCSINNTDVNSDYDLRIEHYYFDACDNIQNFINDEFSDVEQISGRYVSCSLVDMKPNSIASFIFNPKYYSNISGNQLIEKCTNRNYIVKLHVPNASYVKLASTTAIYAGVSYLNSAVQNPSTGEITIDIPGNNIGENGEYSLNLQLIGCDANGGGFQNFTWELVTQCDTDPNCQRSLCSLVYNTTYLHYDCGVVRCVKTTDFSFKRNTFGWKVNRTVSNNQYYSTDLITKYTETELSETELHKAYRGDKIKSILKGEVTSICGTTIKAVIKYQNSFKAFTFISGTMKFSTTENGTFIQGIDCTISPNSPGFTSSYQNNTHTFEVSCSLPQNYSQLFVTFEGEFQVEDDPTINAQVYNIPDIRSYFSTVGNLGEIQSIESWGTPFIVHHVLMKIASQTNSIIACENKIAIALLPDEGNFTQKDFTTEFRPIAHFNKVQKITIPNNYTYKKGSVKIGIYKKNIFQYYYYGNYHTFTNYFLDSKIQFNDDVVGNELTISCKDNFNWPLVENDNINILVIVYEVEANCLSSDTVNKNTLNKLSYSDHDYLFVSQTSTDPNIIVTPTFQNQTNKIVQYTFSKFNITAENTPMKIMQSSNISWGMGGNESILLHNNSSRSLKNFWLAFETTTDVEINYSNVSIYIENYGTVTGVLSKYGPNNKYTIVNFNDIPYNYSTDLRLSLAASLSKCLLKTGNIPINVYVGSNCLPTYYSQISRPTDLGILKCADFLTTLTVHVNEAAASIAPLTKKASDYLSPPTSLTDNICENIYYTTTLQNTSPSKFVYNNKIVIQTPPHVFLEAVSYQYNKGVIKSISNFYPLLNNKYGIDLSTEVSEIQNGFLNSDIILNFKFRTDCNYDPSNKLVSVFYECENSCGYPLNTQNPVNPDLTITGFDNLNDMKFTMSYSISKPFENVVGGVARVRLRIKNENNRAPVDNFVKLNLPKEFTYVQAIAPTPEPDKNFGSYSWRIPSDVLVGGNRDTIVYEFEIKDNVKPNLPPGERPSPCMHASLLLKKSGNNNACSSSCEIVANLSNKKICIPVVPIYTPPRDVKCADCIPSFSPNPGSKYVLSAWVKEDLVQNGLTTYSGPAIKLSYEGSDIIEGPIKASGEIIDGWQRINYEFTVPSTAIKITIDLENEGSNEVFFDDIRIHPFEANMKSFVYDPISMKLVAELDENNYATFYEYDEEGALIRVKKETEKGIMTIKESRNNTIKK
jgi:hypothetical protein